MLDNNRIKIFKNIIIATIIVTFLFFLNFSVLASASIAACVVLWSLGRCIPVIVIPLGVMCALMLPEYTYTLGLMAGYVLCGVSAGIMLRKKVANRLTLLTVCTLSTIVICAMHLLQMHITGASLAETLLGENSVLLSEISMLNPNAVCMSVMLSSGILSGAFIFVLSRVATQYLFVAMAKQDISILKKIPLRNILPTRMWFLSRNYTYGLIACVATVIAVNLLDIANADIITYSLLTVFLFPISMQGICVVRFFLKGMGFGAFSSLLFTAAVCIMPAVSLTLGLVDQFMRFREKKLKAVLIKHGVSDMYNSNNAQFIFINDEEFNTQKYNSTVNKNHDAQNDDTDNDPDSTDDRSDNGQGK